MKGLGNRILTYGLCSSLFLESLFFSGCAYNWKGDTGWKLLKEGTWKQESITKGEPQKTDEKAEARKIEYKIKDVKLTNNILKIPVTEAKTGDLSYCYKQTDKVKYSREEGYYRKNREKINELSRGYSLGYCLLGLLGGFLLGSLAPKKKDTANLDPASGALIGLLAGYLGGRQEAEKDAKEDETEKTCDFEERTTYGIKESPQTYWQKQEGEKIISENMPASNIPIGVSAEFLKFKGENEDLEELLVYTNNEGIANAEITEIITEGENSFSKWELIERTKKKFNNYIKKDAASFLNKIAESLAVKKTPVTIYTKATKEGSDGLEVINDKTEVNVNFYTIDEEGINKAVKKFVDEKINSHIKEVKLYLRDKESHYPIAGARMELKSDAPTQEKIASMYFNNPLLEKALAYVLDYKQQGTESFDEDVITFNAYIPATYNFEITHPKYKFFTASGIKLEEGKLEKIVEMVELGSKERQEDTKAAEGQLLDKK